MYLKIAANKNNQVTALQKSLGSPSKTFIKMNDDGTPAQRNGKTLLAIMDESALKNSLASGEFTHVEC
ncbi:hypothetical protein [Furfurilactobacillus rossiae]|uniref:Uncharacterized protein n=1 Tax=Furfurilactobacillus rossiae DSM 15814 TaxID=1114972 RepID=A0A0R1R886_9LACO|nr:hypothetical protein [Furfurilactobacillus rossiae]KRL53295.1 hypothetical protein FD35_GL001361 [Furfurilactobacillus rossiae DSM 15814]QFR66808.1 hypothetical protein LR814_06725 [Furfurilactobacillus rossiae]QLE62294.1 hypothetical protein LROSRS0_2249 [Furfurilactobacillus rossiae]